MSGENIELVRRIKDGGRVRYAMKTLNGQWKELVGYGSQDANRIAEYNFNLENGISNSGYEAIDGDENVEFDVNELNDDEWIENVADEELLNTDTVIDIEDVSSSTSRLLGGGSELGGISAVSAASGYSTLGVLGGGLGAAAIGGSIFGIASSGIKEDESRPSITLPDHNYIGPGNDETAGLPTVDLDDAIAKEHDIEYSKVKSEQDVFDADIKAISDFTSDFIDNKNIHSGIGAIGLKIKHEIEKKTGVIYPKIETPSSVPGNLL